MSLRLGIWMSLRLGIKPACTKRIRRLMRDILEDVFGNQPLDPMEAARRAVRPQLRRRFYKSVEVTESNAGYALTLDGRPVKTPARRALATPVGDICDMVAQEWRAQRDHVDPATMPLT